MVLRTENTGTSWIFLPKLWKKHLGGKNQPTIVHRSVLWLKKHKETVMAELREQTVSNAVNPRQAEICHNHMFDMKHSRNVTLFLQRLPRVSLLLLSFSGTWSPQSKSFPECFFFLHVFDKTLVTKEEITRNCTFETSNKITTCPVWLKKRGIFHVKASLHTWRSRQLSNGKFQSHQTGTFPKGCKENLVACNYWSGMYGSMFR